VLAFGQVLEHVQLADAGERTMGLPDQRPE
jgi:hypothetical protein